eukprot:GFUD01077470.1.p1 GENE.GFUD01077470.1~~GFUD01077470.1.p1  ORF type:complete len:134 (+),score=20.35 GFUD01077470.1:2-403(+)
MQHFGAPARPYLSFYSFVADPEMIESSEPCGITAKLNVVAGRQKEFLDIMHYNIGETRKEPGMILYDLNADIFDPTVFWLIEKWQSMADLYTHTQTPHFKKTGEEFASTGCLHPENGGLVSLYRTGFERELFQ